jgi:alpha-1,2-mannosyltransferase
LEQECPWGDWYQFDQSAMAASTFVASLAIIPLLPILGLWLIKLAIRAVGWSLESQGRDRRAAIVAKITKDRNSISEGHHLSQEADDGWEKIERTGTAENGQPLRDSWSGIVGFFHPFW